MDSILHPKHYVSETAHAVAWIYALRHRTGHKVVFE